MTKIPIEISARHIHISQKDLEKLFGKNPKIKNVKKLSQSQDYATDKIVEIINPKDKKQKLNARILLPVREKTQTEISITDAYKLKLKKIPPIKISGNLKQASEIIIRNPKNKKQIKSKSLIIAKRHLHINQKDAKKLNLKNNQKVKVKTKGQRALTFDEITVRIKDGYQPALHLDTDEANAAGLIGKKGKKIYGFLE